MIVGTEGQTQEPEEAVDTTAGKGTPRSDAGKQQAQNESASAPADPADPATGGSGGKGAAGGGGGGSNGAGGGGKQPSDPTQDIQNNIALAEAMKPLEGPTADLYSPDKQAARDKLQKDYEKATAPGGDLRKKLNDAHDKFDRAAKDMQPRLGAWTKKLASGPVADLLKDRKDVEAKLTPMSGTNEKARGDSQIETKRWADRHADWSAPADKITALIGTYVDKIDKLNADINNDVNADAAMLSFWFEVAPSHLQVDDRYDDLSAEAKTAIDAVKQAYPDFASKLVPGKDRSKTDGSLWLIPAADLPNKRNWVLGKWIDAAKAQATAEANYKLDPDDSASLKQRWDKLKDDAWIKDAKSKLETAAS